MLCFFWPLLMSIHPDLATSFTTHIILALQRKRDCSIHFESWPARRHTSAPAAYVAIRSHGTNPELNSSTYPSCPTAKMTYLGPVFLQLSPSTLELGLMPLQSPPLACECATKLFAKLWV